MRTRCLTLCSMAGLAMIVGLIAALRSSSTTLAQVPDAGVPALAPIPADPSPFDLPAEEPGLVPAADLASVPSEADPMDEVERFVQHGRQQANEKIEALTREAETLRARLAKVEGALARWKSVAGALEIGAIENFATTPIEHLEPVLPAVQPVELEPALLSEPTSPRGD